MAGDIIIKDDFSHVKQGTVLIIITLPDGAETSVIGIVFVAWLDVIDRIGTTNYSIWGRILTVCASQYRDQTQ